MPGPPGSQPIYADQSEIASATGTATFVFPVSAQAETWTGTFSCPTAPLAAQFTAVVGSQAAVAQGQGTPWGSWGGNSIAGPVQAMSGQAVAIVATGLTPGQSFDMLWRGWTQTANTAQLIYPEPNNSALLAASFPPGVIFGPTSITAGSSVPTVTLPPSARTLIFQIDAPAAVGNVTFLEVGVLVAVGTVSATLYNQAPYLPTFSTFGGTDKIYTVVVPVPPYLPIVPNQIAFEVLTTNPGNVTVTVFADSGQYDESVFYNGPMKTASQGLAATGSAILATGPLRLLTASVETTGSTGNAGTITIGGTSSFILRTDSGSTTPVASALTLPDNTIVPLGVTVEVNMNGTGAVFGGIAYAYP